MSDKNLLQVKNLSAVYETDDGVVRAINDISFTLAERETIGLVGETGAGKTTTALSIMRLLPDPIGKVVGGEIWFNGENLLKISEKKMRLVRGANISMIFQDPMTALNPVLTVGSQILESLVIHNYDNESTAKLEERVSELLELVGIPADRKYNYPHEFSGGMKQRIVIAIALACRPLILIADEPTSALDVTIQAQVLSLMDDLRDDFDASMIMITHDLGVVAETCDKVAVMYAGEIIEFGLLEDVFDREKPHHPYTIGLFKAIPNMKEETDRLIPIEGLMPDAINLPSGCKFHPRCEQRLEECSKIEPFIYTKGNHIIRCNLMKGID